MSTSREAKQHENKLLCFEHLVDEQMLDLSGDTDPLCKGYIQYIL